MDVSRSVQHEHHLQQWDEEGYPPTHQAALENSKHLCLCLDVLKRRCCCVEMILNGFYYKY